MRGRVLARRRTGVVGVVTRVETIGRATLIYSLNDVGGRVRYIGKTVRTLADRFGQHRRAVRMSNLPVGRWLRKHPDATICLIETVGPRGDWAARERFWIERGEDLLNLTKGGEGLAGHTFTTEHRARIAAALRTGRLFTCETCQSEFWRKQRDILKGNCRFCSRPCYAQSLKGVFRKFPALAIERGVKAAAAARKARTHCKREHALSGTNLFVTRSGSRVCKECRKIHKARHRNKADG